MAARARGRAAPRGTAVLAKAAAEPRRRRAADSTRPRAPRRRDARRSDAKPARAQHRRMWAARRPERCSSVPPRPVSSQPVAASTRPRARRAAIARRSIARTARADRHTTAAPHWAVSGSDADPVRQHRRPVRHWVRSTARRAATVTRGTAGIAAAHKISRLASGPTKRSPARLMRARCRFPAPTWTNSGATLVVIASRSIAMDAKGGSSWAAGIPAQGLSVPRNPACPFLAATLPTNFCAMRARTATRSSLISESATAPRPAVAPVSSGAPTEPRRRATDQPDPTFSV